MYKLLYKSYSKNCHSFAIFTIYIAIFTIYYTIFMRKRVRPTFTIQKNDNFHHTQFICASPPNPPKRKTQTLLYNHFPPTRSFSIIIFQPHARSSSPRDNNILNVGRVLDKYVSAPRYLRHPHTQPLSLYTYIYNTRSLTYSRARATLSSGGLEFFPVSTRGAPEDRARAREIAVLSKAESPCGDYMRSARARLYIRDGGARELIFP